VQHIASLTKKALRWVFILGGTLVGIFGLVILDRRWGYPESLSDWVFLFAAALFGFIPLFASVIAARSPSRAGLLFLFSTPFALAASFLTQIDRLRYGMILWYVLLGYSSLATLVIFVLPGLFWLGTQRLNWAPVMSRPESVSQGHKILRIGRNGCSAVVFGFDWCCCVSCTHTAIFYDSSEEFMGKFRLRQFAK